MNRQTIAWCAIAVAIAAGGIASVHADQITREPLAQRRVVLNAGNWGKTLAAGYTTIDQETVWCGHNSGCTFGMSIMANVGQATCRDQWAIVGLVDGTSVDGGPLVGTLPQSGSTDTAMWQGLFKTVTLAGYHNITFQLYVPCSANANQWSVRYLITSR